MLQETSIDSLFKITRDERQELSKQAWIKNRGVGTIEGCTGYGKTRVALNIIKAMTAKHPNVKIIVVVPTTTLKQQWISILVKNEIFSANVLVINTAASNNYECDLLVLDEIHKYAAETFSRVFDTIKFKLILGLTATMERLDGKHLILEKYCPIVDRVPLDMAKKNGWVSDFVEYQVLISVGDIEVYQKLHKEFISHWEFFGFSDIVMKLVGKDGIRKRWEYVDSICQDKTKRNMTMREVTMHAAGYMRTLRKRKDFIYNHVKKLDIARKIINARSDKKIVTFSNNVRMATAIGKGFVYTGKQNKKQNEETIRKFIEMDAAVLNSVNMATEGLDVPNLSVAIVLGINSSKTKAVQSTGRVIRKEGSKYAEIFNIIIENTQEEKWFDLSHKNSQYITIDENNLDKVLKGEPYETYTKKPNKFLYRF